MFRLSGCLLMLLVLSSLAPSQSDGQDAGISARHNAWARFPSGAWKLVRVSTQTLDDSGRVVGTNVTETKTSLSKLDGDCVVLEVEVGVEIAGKQFDGLPKTVKQGFHGEICGGDVKLQPSTTAELTIEDRKIECRSQQIDISTASGRIAVGLCYSDTLAPFILRRESKTTDTANKVVSETLSEVIALDMPERVLTEIKNVSCIKTVQKSSKGTVTTFAMSSPDVPGGVVSQKTKEMDAAGRLIRLSTLDVVSYGTRPEKERTGLFGRKRGVRGRKTMVYPDGTWQK